MAGSLCQTDCFLLPLGQPQGKLGKPLDHGVRIGQGRQGHIPIVGPSLRAFVGPGFFQVSVSLVSGLLQLAGGSSARVEEPSSQDVHTVRAQLRG